MLIKAKDLHAGSHSHIPPPAIYSVFSCICFLTEEDNFQKSKDVWMMGRAGRLLEVSLGPAEDQGFLTKEPLLSFLSYGCLSPSGGGEVKVLFASNLMCVCRCVCYPGGLTP